MYSNIKFRILLICTVFLSNDIFINEALCLSQRFRLPERFNYPIAEPAFNAFKEVYSPISLDVGSPNLTPPRFLRDSLATAASSWNSSFHQYADAGGITELTQEIALLYSKLMNRTLEAKQNVVVTIGATEALYSILEAYTVPGDEWIVMDPMYYMYSVMIKITRGTPKYVRLSPNTEGVTSFSSDWTFDKDELANAFSEKTKGIIINSPHNPTGKIFTEEELRFVADLANKWDVLVIVDEVYECFLYDSNQMTRMATLSDEIFERSVTVNSISKSFVATGWRLGWAIGPADIISSLKKLQPAMIFSHSVPTQVAAAEALKRRRLELGKPDSFSLNFAKLAEAKRDLVVDTLMKIGAAPVIPQAGFFVFVNFTALESKATGLEHETSEFRDQRFVSWLAKKVGVLLMPGTSLFDGKKEFAEEFLRICFLMYLSSDVLINFAQCLSQKFKLPERFNNTFAESAFSAIKEVYSPISLDIGSPDLVPPPFLRDSLSLAARSWDPTFHQYAAQEGIPQLTQEIALLYSNLTKQKLDPEQNVLVTVGASEALYLTFQAYTLPGDEWILIEPVLEIFPTLIKMAQGTPKYIQIKPNTEGVTSTRDWTFDRSEMAEAFNEKTKGIVVNSPHNPTGKIFTEEELRFIADLANKWDVLVVIDEVYEWFMYDSNQMIRMASLSNEIFERSVMVNSISKSFMATGWRLGWAIASAEIINNLKMIQSYLIVSHSVPIQVAAVEGLRRRRLDLGQLGSFTSNIAKLSEIKRDRIVDTLLKIGATPVIPEAGFYVFVNFTALEPRATGLELETDELRDHRFIKWLAKKVGVLVYSGSAFYNNEMIGEDYVRISFVKKQGTIEKASQLLLDWFLQ